ncbi:MAG: OmpA family protein, partial [Bacteroidales bacterium]|nr:OmpA family protein [Bacteroidales bacterium]
ILFFVILSAQTSTAQAYNKQLKLKSCKDSTELLYQKWYIGGLFGSNLFFGDVAESSNIIGLDYDGDFSWLFQLNIGREINQNFGIRSGLSMGKIYSSKSTNHFNADVRNINLDFTVNMSNIILPYKFDKNWNTTIFIGGGVLAYRSILYNADNKVINSVGYNTDGTKDNLLYTPQLNFGIIQSYRVFKNLDINVELSASKLVVDNLDAQIAGSANDLHGKIGIGITYLIGDYNKSYKYNSEPCFLSSIEDEEDHLEKRIDSIEKVYIKSEALDPCDTSTVDTDGDSVPDCRDLEPNTPKGSIVNYQGRAIDNKDTNIIIVSVYFSPVFFEYNKSTVEKTGQQTLSSVAVYLKQNPDKKVLLTGNTGKIGSEEFNINLSAERAEAVKMALIDDYGISEHRIKTKAAGKSDILFDKKVNGNRRVDFTIFQ